MSTGQENQQLSWIERIRAWLSSDKIESQVGGSNMKISYRRTGGFAGMVKSHDIDVDVLPPAEAGEFVALVNAANFFGLPPEIRSESAGADQFQYTLSIGTNEQQHTVEVGDGAVPENLKPLLNKLEILSRSAREP